MIFEHYSRHRKILVVIFTLILLAGLIWLFYSLSSKDQEIACPADAKLCPDGSYVGRIGPDCEFAECPLSETDFGNDYVEQAIIEYLLTQNHFSWKTEDNSHNFCSIEKLDSENELFPFYLWVYCGEYIIRDGDLETLSGLSGPVKIDYPNELSFYDLNRFSYEAPGNGTNYSEDIKNIFPGYLWSIIFDFDQKNIVTRTENLALTNIAQWESIKEAIINCEAESAWQTHNRSVGIKLKNGENLTAIEPRIDDIFLIIEESEEECGSILMATE